MEPAVRALFSVAEIDGMTVVSAEIPGVDISERPVFYRGAGRIRGSYIRVGESDEPMRNDWKIILLKSKKNERIFQKMFPTEKYWN